jgi:hypothetical protein
MIPANTKSEAVLRFCQGISKSDLISVSFRPVIGKPANECFSIVPEYIEKYGGSQVIGWAIWEWPGVLLEAEFHCVWKSPNGELIDISPKDLVGISDISFLPDLEAKYIGHQVNNKMRPLNDSFLVRRFIEAKKRLFLELNKGDLAGYHGEVELSERGARIYNKFHLLRQKMVEKYGNNLN